jgi:transposase
MAKPLLPDDLWELIEPLIPLHPARPKGGRPPLEDRQALTGIIFVLKTGIPWEYLPQEMGCGCGMTCWRRLRAWFRAGVWEQIHQHLLSRLRFLKKIDFARFLIDTCHVRAVGGGAQTGPSPVDRSKLGSKIELITDAQGVPVVVGVCPANHNDNLDTIKLIDRVPPIAGVRGRPRRRPERLQGDRGFDDEDDRKQLRQRRIIPELAKRRTKHGSGLGKFRWFIERTNSWFKQFRRVRVRYDRIPAIYYSFLKLAAALICFRIANSGFS